MKSILIIDDDETYRNVLARRLRHTHQFKVVAVASLQQALEQAIRIDSILLDMLLGEDSGLDAIPALHRHFHPDQLIILTGFASIATTVEAIKRGATDYLAKPVSLSELVTRLSSVTADIEPPGSWQPMTPAQVEWEYLQRILQHYHGNISATADALGMHRRSLQRKLRKFSPH